MVETSEADGITLIQGRLDIGVAMAPPLIRAAKSFLDEGGSVKAAAGLALLSWAADLSREDEVIEACSSRNERRRTVERMKELAQDYLDMAGYKPAAARPSFRQINVDWTPHVAAEREYNEDNA